MNDQEFDVLDELYFVQSFEEVQEACGLESAQLRDVLQGLLKKGWIRCMESRTGEGREVAGPEFSSKYHQYFYLATKAGLLAHNSR